MTSSCRYATTGYWRNGSSPAVRRSNLCQFVPATPISSSAFRLRARLLNDALITIDESTVSVGETDADGWLDIEFSTTPLTSGRRYGVHLSSAVLADECFGLDATNNLRIGWGKAASAGLNVNGTMYPAQAIQMRVNAAGGIKPAIHMLAQATRVAPESAVALVIAGAAWFATVVSFVFRLPGSRTNPWMKTLSLAAAVSLTAGTELAGRCLAAGLIEWARAVCSTAF